MVYILGRVPEYLLTSGTLGHGLGVGVVGWLGVREEEINFTRGLGLGLGENYARFPRSIFGSIFGSIFVQEGPIGLYDLVEFFDDGVDVVGVELGSYIVELGGVEGTKVPDVVDDDIVVIDTKYFVGVLGIGSHIILGNDSTAVIHTMNGGRGPFGGLSGGGGMVISHTYRLGQLGVHVFTHDTC